MQLLHAGVPLTLLLDLAGTPSSAALQADEQPGEPAQRRRAG